MAYGRGGGVRELVLRAVWRKGEAALGEDMDLVSKAEELLGSCSSIFRPILATIVCGLVCTLLVLDQG